MYVISIPSILVLVELLGFKRHEDELYDGTNYKKHHTKDLRRKVNHAFRETDSIVDGVVRPCLSCVTFLYYVFIVVALRWIDQTKPYFFSGRSPVTGPDLSHVTVPGPEATTTKGTSPGGS